MKYGYKYLPHVGKLSNYASQLWIALKELQLNHVSRIDMKFDPFTGQKANSLRCVWVW